MYIEDNQGIIMIRRQSFERILTYIDHDMYNEVVIVGEHAAALAFGWNVPATPVTIVSSKALLMRLTSPEWQRVGDTFIHKTGKVKIRDQYGTASYKALVERGWTPASGIHVAGLPDIYATEQQQGDTALTRKIRQRLQDPYLPPLMLSVMPRELRLVTNLIISIPAYEADPHIASALRLSTNALYTLFTLYGDPQIATINQIVGALEQPAHNTMAYYHNGFDTLSDLGDLLQHLTNIEASTAERLDALVADLYTDIIYGHGRASDSPFAYDERLSGNLLYAHAVQVGYPPQRAERLRSVVLATSFDERTKQQVGKPSADPVSRAIVSADLQTLARPGVRSSIDITLENLVSRRHPTANLILSKLQTEDAIRLTTYEDTLDYIHENRHRRPKDSPDGPTLIETFTEQLEDSAAFHEAYQPAHDWTLDSPQIRQKNAHRLRELVAEIHFNSTATLAEICQRFALLET